MPPLEPRAARVQIGGPTSTRTQGAPTQGRGLQALGQSINRVGNQLAAFRTQTQRQVEQARARQAASERVLEMGVEFARLQQSTTDPEELFKATEQLLKDFIRLTPDQQKALGPFGTQTFTTTVGGQLPSFMGQVLGFHRTFALATAKAETDRAIETNIRQIALSPEGSRQPQLDSFVQYLDGLDPAVFPDAPQIKQHALDRVAFGIALDRAHQHPTDVLKQLDTTGGFAIHLGGGHVVQMSPEQQQQLRDEARQGLQDEQSRAATQRTLDTQQRLERRKAAKNRGLGMLIDGDPSALSTIRSWLGGPGQVGPALIDSEDFEGLFRFKHTLDTARAEGGAGNLRTQSEWLIRVKLGQIHDPYQILNETTMNGTQKQAVLNAWTDDQRKQGDLGRAQYLRAKSDALDAIDQALGGKLSIFQRIDPEGQELLATIKLQFAGQIEAEYDRIHQEVGTAGPAFQTALQALDVRARGFAFLQDKLKDPTLFRGRLRTRVDAAAALMRPYLTESTFDADLARDLAAGDLTTVDVAMMRLLKQHVNKRGLTLDRLERGERPPGTATEELGAEFTKPRSFTADLKAMFREFFEGLMSEAAEEVRGGKTD